MVFSPTYDKNELKQQKYMQQNEIRRALELQILEKKRLQEEERRRQLEQDQKDELRLQQAIQKEKMEAENDPNSNSYKMKRPKKLNPQFMQTMDKNDSYFGNIQPNVTSNFACSTVDKSEEYKETPSLAEVKASDLYEHPRNTERLVGNGLQISNENADPQIMGLQKQILIR